ncbi:demethylase [Aureococcus anophagefferens]|nr:demethylase [Aureococcus anophagefferens]
MEPKRGPGAREKRKRAVVDYAAFDEGLGTEKPSTLSRWVPTLASVECLPAEAFVERMADGRGFDEAWARRTGLRRPALIADAAGLGLAVPSGSFGVRDVARIVGERTPVQVMRSQDQSSVENWSLADWARYWHAPVREDTLNVISLEFSRTPLAAHVRSPALVRRLDWIDNCFPDAYRARGEYPQTQYYCLMSTGGCYTDFHVDFGGTAVWYHVFRGSKVFYVLEPTAAHLAAYERWICDADQDSTWFPDVAAADGPCACARVEVRAGETFFIPSGWIHAVHTPADSLVFGGNFLPGLCTADLQLAVHDIEARTHVKQEYRFPFFVPCMFWGVKCALDRLNERPDGLGSQRRGLAALVDACGAWARDGCARIHCARQRAWRSSRRRTRASTRPARRRRAAALRARRARAKFVFRAGPRPEERFVAAPPPPPAPEAVEARPAMAPARPPRGPPAASPAAKKPRAAKPKAASTAKSRLLAKISKKR